MKILNLAISFWIAAAGIGQLFAVPAAPVVCPASLQALVTAAPAGGTLYVPACTFTESITIDKDLAVVGATSGGVTILNAPVGERAITLTGDHTLNLQNFTITGGSPDTGGGGAILANEGSLQISHCHIYNNSASDGGAIYQGNAAGTDYLTEDVIEDNHVTGQGGGMFANGTVISTNTVFSTNTAGSHGGGMSVWTGSANINGGSFAGNTAALNGGGVNINNGLSVTGVDFNDNISGDSGGAITQWNASYTISITQSNFHRNKAKNHGGGIYVNSVVFLNQDWFDANVVDSGAVSDTSGGGVHAGNSGGITASPAVTVLNSKFTGNEARCKSGCYSEGGGIYIDSKGNGTTPTLAVMSNDLFDANK